MSTDKTTTNYYSRKVEAFKDIDGLLADGEPYDVIVFKIATKYGFTKRIVDERMNDIKKATIAKKERSDGGGQ